MGQPVFARDIDIDLQQAKMSPRELWGEQSMQKAHAQCSHCTLEDKPVSWWTVHKSAPRATPQSVGDRRAVKRSLL